MPAPFIFGSLSRSQVIGFINGGDNFIPAAARGTKRPALMHAVDILPTLVGLVNQTAGEGTDGAP